MMLAEEQVAFFKEHGYLALPEFWTPREVAAMQAEVERFKREGLLRNVTTEGDGKTHSKTRQNLQLCPMADKSPLFRALPFEPKVVEAVRQLIGDPVLLHLDQIFLKPAHHGTGTNWHQDNAYFALEDPLKGTALWIAVHEATVENGTMHIIPDAFREKLPHSRDPESDHHIRCYPPEERAIPIELPAGGVVFFAYGTPHCTKANHSDKERAGAAFHFHNGNYAADGGYPLERRIPLTGPETDDGTRTYGKRVANTWQEEVERALQLAQAYGE
ncbi:MAG TPA: phytanoyl-CoA dioxygenase family protein [Chthonomonas sp.]|jgi:phytanoyl-CoA hydroxylase|uniref:phytanoyl-CoA dioxygenase family protein n=1 Tax=Chthonomonas sp. TaxID=2282153 RepID=UPI002B4B4F28|nr:phytanoyl-CoA dioxygenase family protein [Chthonomonas sp.]HLH79126.1 phytanoyl-CoA dioxygenase family protein [Chthonomonas sp.]